MTAKRTVKIPELDELIIPDRCWSEEEKEILKQYYKKVPSVELLRYLNRKYNKGRTLDALRKKAREVCCYDISGTEAED